MKKKIACCIGFSAFIALMFFNIQFSANNNNNSQTISSFVSQAFADSETTLCPSMKTAGICHSTPDRTCVGNASGYVFSCPESYSS